MEYRQVRPTERRLAPDAVDSLRGLLPAGWELSVQEASRLPSGDEPDMVLTMAAPDGVLVTFVVAIRRGGTGAVAQDAIGELRAYTEGWPEARGLFVAPWLSERSRELLASADIGYLDATGNVRLVADRPGLFVTTRGADRNPWPADSGLQSLRGKGAARAVRALVDHRPPFGVRELAGRTEASAATLSRVAALLEDEGLLQRDQRGGIRGLDWAGSLRRWAQDYDVQRSNDATTWLAPRGLDSLASSLRSTEVRYALTGSLAAHEFAPYAPARLGMVYVDSVSEAAEVLGLRPVDTGANVVLLAPFDDVVFARTVERSGLTVVNPSQLAADLLTSPGRAPSEGEELLQWMEDNLDVWRA